MEGHAAGLLEALSPWVDGHRMPSFTFAAEEYVDAYDKPTVARLRAAISTYDPHGVMAIGHVLGAAYPARP